MKFLVFVSKSGREITYLVNADVQKDAEEAGMSVGEFIAEHNDKLILKGKVEIVGEAAGFLPDVLVDQ